MTINLKPLGSRVVIEPLEQEEVTAGGIVLPETAKEKPQKGVGPSKQKAEQAAATNALSRYFPD